MAYGWTLKTNPGLANGVTGYATGSNLWVSSGNGITQLAISYSTDGGNTWTAATVATETGGSGMILVDALHSIGLAATSVADVLRSTDAGDTWIVISPAPTAGWSGSPVTADGIGTDGAGNWLLLNTNGTDTATSSDGGATWAQHLGVGPGVAWNGGTQILWDGTQWVASAIDASNDTWICTSPDGATWTSTSMGTLTIATPVFNGSTYGVGAQASLGTGAWGVVFASTPAGLATATFVDLTSVGIVSGALLTWDAVNSLWLVADGSGHTASSPDGVTWTAGATVPGTSPAITNVYPGGTGTFVFDGESGGGVAEGAPVGVVVPDVVGDTQAAASAAIVGAGLMVGTITTAYSDTVAVGLVISQAPVAGDTVPSGSFVGLVLSLGPQIVAVPDVIGLTAALANEAIDGVGLVTGTDTGVISQSIPIGSVATQDPAAGTMVEVGTPVNLGISFVSPVFDVDATVISQYANSPIIVELVENFGQYFDPTANIQQFYLDVWNIDTAEGFGLDIWGRILGVSRVIPIPGMTDDFGFDNSDSPPDWENFGNVNDPTAGGPFFSGQLIGNSYKLNDDPYRTLLLTKAMANICATTGQALNALITNLFPGRGVCYTQDDGGMQMTYVFKFALSTIEEAILENSGVLSHPAGVGVSITVSP